MCLGDALDDCQAEADTCVVGAYAFGAAKKRLAKRGNQLWGELLAGVLDREHHRPSDVVIGTIVPASIQPCSSKPPTNAPTPEPRSSGATPTKWT